MPNFIQTTAWSRKACVNDQKIVQIDPSVTQEQFEDPRFQELLREFEESYNAPDSDLFKLLIGLHESGHAYFARKAGATNVRYRPPTLMWDYRPPKYDCPAISRAATIYVLPADCTLVNRMKASIAGYICRRELSGWPNDLTAIESDLDSCRNWYANNVGGEEAAFNAAVQDAGRELLIDLRSPKTRREIWEEARRVVAEIFPTDPKLN
jgi:hypothetical protein